MARRKRSPLERAIAEIAAITPEHVDDVGDVVLGLIAELEPAEFIQIRANLLTWLALGEAQRPAARR